ncbi:hypothetical protein LCGC14_0805070 [marine sediment metagenome]|uniref:Primase C-terminal 2 domain-containing protein n=1 Tax=marine sediment metagenome TaxID=412755 RepID=A0A0F9S8L4_9ZZZZ
MPRVLTDWLAYYVDYACQPTESPVSYHQWIGLSLLAGALQRKGFIRWGHDKIYPNMYNVIVGPSGRTRKGMAMGIGMDILNQVPGIDITAEQVTREQLIRSMAGSLKMYRDEGSSIVKNHSSVTVFSPELAVFIGQSNVAFLADLTDWYDCGGAKGTWKRETKNAGHDEIIGPFLNLIGATAPDWIQSMLPQEAIGGGFTSRVIFIVEENKRKVIPIPKVTIDHNKLRRWLIHDLIEISKSAGEFTLTPKALQAYATWYQEQENDADNGIYPIIDTRFRGYCERRATHVKKIAMLLSVGRGNSMEITEQDFDDARYMLARIEPKMDRVFGGLGSSPSAGAVHDVMRFIQSKGEVTRTEVLNIFYRDIGSSSALEIIEETLVAMKRIRAVRDTKKRETVYYATTPKKEAARVKEEEKKK